MRPVGSKPVPHLHVARCRARPNPTRNSCHAGHGQWKNVSDALLWLHYFNHSGSAVLAIDAFEDYALDLTHRLRHLEPYASLPVEAWAVAAKISNQDRPHVDATPFAVIPMKCCIGVECGWEGREAAGALDHMCRITRQRLGLQPITRSLAPPPASFDHTVLRGFARHIRNALPRRVTRLPRPGTPFRIRAARMDTLWRHDLRSRHIDVLKVRTALRASQPKPLPQSRHSCSAPVHALQAKPHGPSLPLPAPPCPSLPSIFRPAPSRHTALAGPRRLADPVGSLASHRGMAMLCTRHSGDQLSKRLAPTISSGALCCFRRGLGYGGIARRVAAGRLPHGVPHGGFD